MAETKMDFQSSRSHSISAIEFKELFDQYYKPLCSFANKYLLDLSVAEDIIQELFVKFWEQRETTQLTISAKSYLFQAAKNECLNYIKHQAVQAKYKKHLAYVSTDSFFYDSMEKEEINHLIYQTIQTLPPRCKQIFEMSRFEDKTFDEIASELDISRNTIKNQLVSALKKIRSVLEQNEILVLTSIFIKMAESFLLLFQK